MGRILVGKAVEIVGVGIDGTSDRIAPTFGAESVDVFVPGEVHGLDQDLAAVSESRGGPGYDVTLSGSGEDAAEGGAEIAGGDVIAGEEEGDVAAELVGGAGLGFFAGMEKTVG